MLKKKFVHFVKWILKPNKCLKKTNIINEIVTIRINYHLLYVRQFLNPMFEEEFRFFTRQEYFHDA